MFCTTEERQSARLKPTRVLLWPQNFPLHISAGFTEVPALIFDPTLPMNTISSSTMHGR